MTDLENNGYPLPLDVEDLFASIGATVLSCFSGLSSTGCCGDSGHVLACVASSTVDRGDVYVLEVVLFSPERD